MKKLSYNLQEYHLIPPPPQYPKREMQVIVAKIYYNLPCLCSVHLRLTDLTHKPCNQQKYEDVQTMLWDLIYLILCKK